MEKVHAQSVRRVAQSVRHFRCKAVARLVVRRLAKSVTKSTPQWSKSWGLNTLRQKNAFHSIHCQGTTSFPPSIRQVHFAIDVHVTVPPLQVLQPTVAHNLKWGDCDIAKRGDRDIDVECNGGSVDGMSRLPPTLNLAHCRS